MCGELLRVVEWDGLLHFPTGCLVYLGACFICRGRLRRNLRIWFLLHHLVHARFIEGGLWCWRTWSLHGHGLFVFGQKLFWMERPARGAHILLRSPL